MSDKQQEIQDLRARLEALEAVEMDIQGPSVVSVAPKSKSYGWEVWVGAACAAAVGICFLAWNDARLKDMATRNPALTAPDSEPVGWRYRATIDPLTGDSGQEACTTSRNEVVQDFPYKSGRADLCLMDRPGKGVDIMVRLVNGGHILCHDCTVKIRFDDAAPLPLAAGLPSDGSTATIFLASPERAVSRLKNTTVTRVELELYQAGKQVLFFSTSNLTWPIPLSEGHGA